MCKMEQWEENATIDMIHACEGLSLRQINTFRFIVETAKFKGLDLEDLACFLQATSDKLEPLKEEVRLDGHSH